MEKLAELCLKQLRLDNTAPPFLQRMYPDENTILRSFEQYGLETVDGFLDLLDAPSPPSPAWFRNHSFPIVPGYFGVYVLLFAKRTAIPQDELRMVVGDDGQNELDDEQPLTRSEYKVYVGKGASMYKHTGVYDRLQGYLHPIPEYSTGCQAAVKDGFRLIARSLVATFAIPPHPARGDTLLLCLEASTRHAFGMNERTYSNTMVAIHMLLWPHEQLSYAGYNRASALLEAKNLLDKLDLTPEEIARAAIERRSRRLEGNKNYKLRVKGTGGAVCPRCQYASNDRYELQKHRERAEKWQAKEFPCPFCCTGSARFGTRSTHVKKCHPEKVAECRRTGLIAQTHSTALAARWARGDFN